MAACSVAPTEAMNAPASMPLTAARHESSIARSRPSIVTAASTRATVSIALVATSSQVAVGIVAEKPSATSAPDQWSR
ncbi:hypothetical protein [Agrococcus sp. TSP3-2-1]|uniref:hypothetical protein n=1 Tax=Agrococcus sp. TSP3-2-1 TaxID=2804583 RepID=UPI003CED5559